MNSELFSEVPFATLSLFHLSIIFDNFSLNLYPFLYHLISLSTSLKTQFLFLSSLPPPTRDGGIPQCHPSTGPYYLVSSCLFIIKLTDL